MNFGIRMKLYRLGAFAVALVLLAAHAQAQYHLTELGVVGGLGLALPLGYSSNVRHETGLAIPVSGYFSHWVCGKNWGYQFDLGLNYAAQRLSYSSEKPIDPVDAIPTARLQAIWLHAVLSFKIRANNYHRAHEIFWLLGPVVQSRLWSQAVLQLDPFSSKSSLAGRGQLFRLGGHAGLWIRFPMRKSLSWFLVPGVEILTPYQMRTARHPDSYWMEFWQPTLRAGFTLWNNR